MEGRKEAIENILLTVGAMFRMEVTSVLINAWEYALKDLSETELTNGFSRILTEYTDSFPPTPAKFIFYARSEAGIKDEKAEAKAAWAIVYKALSTVGYQYSPVFKDKAIANTIRALGGWLALKRLDYDELEFKKHDFFALYGASKYKEGELYCIGFCDFENSKKNSELPPSQFKYVGAWSGELKDTFLLEQDQQKNNRIEYKRQMLKRLEAE